MRWIYLYRNSHEHALNTFVTPVIAHPLLLLVDPSDRRQYSRKPYKKPQMRIQKTLQASAYIASHFRMR